MAKKLDKGGSKAHRWQAARLEGKVKQAGIRNIRKKPKSGR